LPELPEHDDESDAPLTPTRTWVPVVLIVSLLLLAGAVGAWWLGGSDDEAVPRATAPGPSEPEPSKQPEPSEPEPSEPEPEPSEPEPSEPEPSEPEPSELEPINTDGPDELERPREPEHRSPACAKVRDDAADALASKQWDTADRLARKSSCWSRQVERLRIRVKALAQSERYAECVRVGGDHEDKEIQKWVNICRGSLP
jgi:hypothetical protein